MAATEAASREPMIRLERLTKVYGEVEAVSDLTLDVAAGDLVCLVGPSGCGKTTTLKSINRLVEPTSGTVYVGGRDVRSVPAPELRRGIGYVIQQVGLFPHRTIGENIATVPDLRGWSRARVADRVRELVDLVGLSEALLDRYPAELSGGQQQRVGVARALAADPPVLLMDEPFGAVDPIVRARLQGELVGLQKRLEKTIVFVTHDIDEAIALADRIAVMRTGGVLAQYATPSELLRSPADDFVAGFLGAERGLRRLSLVRVGDLDLDGPGHAVSDAVPTIDENATLREALEVVLSVPERAVVVDGEAGSRRILTLDRISAEMGR